MISNGRHASHLCQRHCYIPVNRWPLSPASRPLPSPARSPLDAVNCCEPCRLHPPLSLLVSKDRRGCHHRIYVNEDVIDRRGCSHRGCRGPARIGSTRWREGEWIERRDRERENKGISVTTDVITGEGPTLPP